MPNTWDLSGQRIFATFYSILPCPCGVPCETLYNKSCQIPLPELSFSLINCISRQWEFNFFPIFLSSIEDEVEESIETAAEDGMLDDLYSIIKVTTGQTQCKVIQILAELAKVGRFSGKTCVM